jgi:N-acetylneuraminic acid mutarotase
MKLLKGCKLFKTKAVSLLAPSLLLSLITFLSGVLFVTSAHAQGTVRMLRGHMPSVLSTLQPIGLPPATNILRLSIGLPLRNSEGLSNFLHQVYDPSSTSYRRFLTPKQFADQFGPSEQDYQRVIDFVQANGLAVTGTTSNRMVLDVRGFVPDVEAAFGVTIQVYQHPTEFRTFYAPNREPSVPATVPILDISGLDNYEPPHPASLSSGSGAANGTQGQSPANPPGFRGGSVNSSGGVTPAVGSGTGGSYIGYDFRHAYAPGVALTGAGQVVGLVQFDGYYTSDITTYESQAGLPNVPLQNILIDGFNGAPGVNAVEVSLDIEMAISMAPGLSQVTLYEAPADQSYANDILNEMAAPTHGEPLPNQLSCSWLWLVAKATTDQILQEMAAQGQSFFVASGDGDAWCGQIWAPEDDPWATSVGGTTLTTGSGASYSSETVWNWGAAGTWGPNGNGYEGSGGGISTDYLIPSWQQGINMSANGGSTTFRNIPDVAMVSDNILILYGNGQSRISGGTSASAPLWAGFTALLNQKALANGGTPVGNLNPTIYSVGSTAGSFHDITTGNNNNGCNGFSAVPGYDLCTGWGSPNGISTIDALTHSQTDFFATGSMNNSRSSHTATLLQNGKVLVAGGFATTGETGSAELYDQSTGTWTVTGSLNTGRQEHTATLLQNGKVLVAGGYSSSVGMLNSIEIYDPAAGTWSAGSPMGAARYDHTAVLLQNGKVLVTGGNGLNGYLTSAELYDPSTGQWTSASPMQVGRIGHTMTLLQDGRVLVAGGYGDSGYLNEAEIYNPANNSWTAINLMNSQRYLHTATLLPSGKVLIAAGFNSVNEYLNTAELYDPIAGTWTLTGNLTTGRQSHAATLLDDGKVLVTGGQNSGVLNSAELYDPATGSWTATEPMLAARAFHTATLLVGGRVLIAGGEHNGFALNSAELYGADNGFVVSGSMNFGRFYHTATLLSPSYGNKLLVAGGWGGGNTAELYNPVSGAWTLTGSMSTRRMNHTATMLSSGKVLVTGGDGANNGQGSSTLSSVEVYDPSAGTWTLANPMHQPREWHTATLLSDGFRVMVTGGDIVGVGGNPTTEVYDPGTGQWTLKGNLQTARFAHTATLLTTGPNKGKVLVAGGAVLGTVFASAELYDPNLGTWSYTGSMNTPRNGHIATVLPSGKVLVVGGENASGPISSAELYDPNTGLWTPTGSLNTGGRWLQAAALQADGTVLIAGGAISGTYLSSAEVYNPGTGTWAISAPLNAARGAATATPLPNGKILIAGGQGIGEVQLSSTELYLDPPNTVWIDDALPVGAVTTSDNGDSWNWISSNPTPFSGSFAFQQANIAGEHLVQFTGASQQMYVGTNDTMYTYVYLDPVNTPDEIVLIWIDETGPFGNLHVAWWGSWRIAWWNQNQTANMGALPPAGQWVKLTVPANAIGLGGHTLNGMGFMLHNGRATWDNIGKYTE